MTRIQQTETKVLFLRDCPATGACMCAGWCNEIEYEIPIEDWKAFLEKYKTGKITNIKFT